MRVIGIDPGSRICGWGVVEDTTGPHKIQHVDSGAVFTDAKQELPQRLQAIYEGLRAAIRAFDPREAAVESVFHHKTAKSALVLGQARGVAILACVHEGLPVYEYTPMQIKQAVTGYGKADKRQVGLMVKSLLRLPEEAWVDTADALASAICHLNSRKLAQATKHLNKRSET